MTDVEAGTGLVGVEVLVADETGIGVEVEEEGEDLVQRYQLLGGAGIGGMTIVGEAAFVTDADTVAVVVRDVTARQGHRTTVVDRAIATHVDVVAGVGAEAAGSMVADQALEGVVDAGPCGGAMHHQEVNLSR